MNKLLIMIASFVFCANAYGATDLPVGLPGFPANLKSWHHVAFPSCLLTKTDGQNVRHTIDLYDQKNADGKGSVTMVEIQSLGGEPYLAVITRSSPKEKGYVIHEMRSFIRDRADDPNGVWTEQAWPTPIKGKETRWAIEMFADKLYLAPLGLSTEKILACRKAQAHQTPVKL